MGNCQAAEAATVIIQHPGKKVERIYWSVSARQVMNSNPGHFVALVVAPPPAMAKLENATLVKHLKLLRPDDTLLLGQVYRLVCLEDILKEFAVKKCVKLRKLLEGGGIVLDKSKLCDGLNLKANLKPENYPLRKEEQKNGHHQRLSSSSGGSGSKGGRGMGRSQNSGGQWKPALQSISELGT